MWSSKYITLLHPPDPIVFVPMERPAEDVLKSSFANIDGVSPDSSVTRRCSLVIGRPRFGENNKRSGIAFSQIADERVSFSKAACLGVQHAWDMCRRQRDFPFLRLPGIVRIWFWGMCVYEPISATEADSVFGVAGGEPTGGGEFRFAMVRDGEDLPWKVGTVPACCYDPDSDCIALAELLP